MSVRTDRDLSAPTRGNGLSRSRRRLFAAAAMLLGCALSIAGLEAGLRLWTPAWLEQRMAELNAGTGSRSPSPGGATREIGTDRAWPIVTEGSAFRQFEPRSSFTVRHYEYRHTVTIDELGGRAMPYRAGYQDIVPFLGDSFTFGVGVEDDETFVSLLAAEGLRSPIGQESPPRLLNLGMTGTALHNQLDTLKLRHDELGRPRLYVFSVFLGNDLTNVRRHHRRSAPDAASPGGGGSRQWLWRANVFVYHHPALKRIYAIQFLRQKLLAAVNRGNGGFMEPVFLAMRTDLPYLDESLVFWRWELARLQEISSRLGFEVLLILIPDVHQLDGARRAGKAASLGLAPEVLDAGQITRAVARTLEEARIPYLDVGPCLAQAAVDGLYYTQDTHFTAIGHARAARCISGSGRLNRLLAADRSAARPARNAS